jgi:hypothetical protein
VDEAQTLETRLRPPSLRLAPTPRLGRARCCNTQNAQVNEMTRYWHPTPGCTREPLIAMKHVTIH